MGKRFFDNSAIAERIHISRNNTLDVIPEYKFGAVPSMSQSTTGSVWDVNDTPYPWSALSSPVTPTVDRANVGDAGKTVEIYGLDSNFNLQSEEITLTNATGNSAANLYSRIFRVKMTGGSAINIGDIDVKAAATTIARITAGLGQTLMSVYTIPAEYTGFLVKMHVSAEAGADATFHVFVDEGGVGSFNIKHTGELSGNSSSLYEWEFPLRIPAKSDIDVEITTRTNNGRYSCGFEMLLYRNTS